MHYMDTHVGELREGEEKRGGGEVQDLPKTVRSSDATLPASSEVPPTSGAARTRARGKRVVMRPIRAARIREFGSSTRADP